MKRLYAKPGQGVNRFGPRAEFKALLIFVSPVDAKEFFRQEDWTVNPAKIGTTMYLQKIASLQKHNATVAWQVAGGSTEYGADKVWEYILMGTNAALTRCFAVGCSRSVCQQDQRVLP